MKRKVGTNAITGFVTQIIVIVLGIIVPRIMLTKYGSDTNGMITTLTQIFSYVALLEAGIGQSTRNALYKPIATKNRSGISEVMTLSRKYYWRITRFYAGIVVIMSFVMPFLLKTNLSWHTVCLVILFEGMSGVIRFMFTENWMQLLVAEGKGYVQANINLVGTIFSHVAKIVLACIHINIVFMQIVFFAVSLIKLFIYKAYIDKHYSWIDYRSLISEDTKLPDRDSYVLIEVAWTVFSSTDMILISILFSTALSSVYSVYNMIYSNLSLLLNAVYTGLLYMLGQAFHKSIKEYTKVHDQFELFFMTAVAVLMSCCSLLTIPFIKIYTDGVTDINYIYMFLPFLFGLIQILSWDRYVAGNLSGIAGYAQVVSKISVVEAVSNIILSVILSIKFGLYGITLATVLSLLFKLTYLTVMTNRRILKRGITKSLSKIVVYLLAYTVITFVGIYRPLEIPSLFSFLVVGMAVLVSVSLIFLILAILVDKHTFKTIIKKVSRRHT